MRIKLLDDSIKGIDVLVKELKEKYGRIDLKTLERIAKEEFGVEEVIEVPFMIRSVIVESGIDPKKYYIIYSGFCNNSKKLNLSDEICHIARRDLHFGCHRSYEIPCIELYREDYAHSEVSYFISKLIGIPQWKQNLYKAALYFLRAMTDFIGLEEYRDYDKSQVLALISKYKRS